MRPAVVTGARTTRPGGGDQVGAAAGALAASWLEAVACEPPEVHQPGAPCRSPSRGVRGTRTVCPVCNPELAAKRLAQDTLFGGVA